MNTREIIEAINKLTEDAVEEEVLQDIPEEEPETAPAFNDGMSLADTLDAKTKIARALENLEAAIEEFKNATAEKIDLLKDELLLAGQEELDACIDNIKNALANGSNILDTNTGLNDPFKAELPVEEEPVGEETEEAEEIEEEPGVESDFDNEAGLDLFGDEAESI